MPQKLPPMPSRKTIRFRKVLSAPGLLTAVRKQFENLPEHRRGRKVYSLPDVLMSGLAMFGLKYPSLLQFDHARLERTVKANLKPLYGVEQAPCDTQMREVLDPVNPNSLRSAFTTIHKQLQRQTVLVKYQYLGGYLVSIDGTGQFSSTHLSCPDCCSRTLRNNHRQYYHQLLGAVIVHPQRNQVLPLFPEAITRQDGDTKNDCERNASKRLLPALRQAFPKLKMIIVEDALASNVPHLKLLEELSLSYIIVVKPKDHAYLFDHVSQLQKSGKGIQFETISANGIGRRYHFVNQVPLNASHPEWLVNFIEYWEWKEGQELYHNTWITNIERHRDNAFDLTQAGRARWKVENETFNTLKTQGYNLEHNYGHGNPHLSTVLAMLMMLHFLIDQVQELAGPVFKAARGRYPSRIQLWATLRSRFCEHLLPSWEILFKSIIYGIKPDIIQLDTS
jgi:Transposase DDE domain